eukprot:TRINITY_DN9468_c0_g1_i5.p1 TRINITY_DN9468_c0_g1~~TRINITY_DN9468_c0_g1_i5.p1  ORF type:complete len:354 (-),score=58.55 TRINITY_DN9468_c0_g1_i5:366-1427(-)
MDEMPAFKADGRPLWQIIVTPRKIVLDVHHGLVDGLGLAVISASVLQGKTLAEANKEMCANLKKPRESGSEGFFSKLVIGLKAACIIWWYLATPILGLLKPESKSAIFAQGQPGKKRARLVHLGPYNLEHLKNASHRSGTALNGLLGYAIAQGLHAYCRATDGDDAALPSRMAVPVTFKNPQLEDPSQMNANNDFSTVAMAVPAPLANGLSPNSADRMDRVPLADGLPTVQMPRIDISESLAARNAQILLSLLPLPVIRWLYQTSSRLFSFCFSNVDASWAGLEFRTATGSVMRRIRVYGFGAAPGDISLFILVNSHGSELHVGVTAGSYIKDVRAMSQAIHVEISKIAQVYP